MKKSIPTLFIFSGLPATGKSTLAQGLSKHIHGVYLRIDTIEQGKESEIYATSQLKEKVTE